MLPLVHNTIVRNRSNTMPSSSHSNHSTSMSNVATTNDASSNSTNNNSQYAVQFTKDSSECKKLKSSKVCITTNNRSFLKKRSLTFSSLFSPKSSRSASTNSLQSSLVDETLAACLRFVLFIFFKFIN